MFMFQLARFGNGCSRQLGLSFFIPAGDQMRIDKLKSDLQKSRL